MAAEGRDLWTWDGEGLVREREALDDRRVERLLPPPERPMPMPKIGTGEKTLKSRARSADRAEGPASTDTPPPTSVTPLAPPPVTRDVRSVPVAPAPAPVIVPAPTPSVRYVPAPSISTFEFHGSAAPSCSGFT